MKRKMLILLLILFAMTNYVTPPMGALIITTDKPINKVELSDDTLKKHYPITAKDFKATKIIYKKTIKKRKHKGYANTSVNVRASPTKKSKIKYTLSYGTPVKYTSVGNGWCKIGKKKYVKKKYISKGKPKYKIYNIPEYSGMKSFMDYQKITDTSSPQYKLQQYAYTGNYGIREIDGRYCVAVGHYITTKIGVYLDLVLDNGTIIPCVLSDQKNPAHTDGIFTLHSDCASEFVVEEEALNNKASIFGDISKCNSDWDSPVVQIKVYEKRIYEGED